MGTVASNVMSTKVGGMLNLIHFTEFTKVLVVVIGYDWEYFTRNSHEYSKVSSTHLIRVILRIALATYRYTLIADCPHPGGFY